MSRHAIPEPELSDSRKKCLVAELSHSLAYAPAAGSGYKVNNPAHSAFSSVRDTIIASHLEAGRQGGAFYSLNIDTN